MFKLYIVFVLLLTSLMSIAAPVAETQPEDSILLTVLLKHDQSNSFEEYQKILEEQKFFDKFPPEGVTVVSWYVMMCACFSKMMCCLSQPFLPSLCQFRSFDEGEGRDEGQRVPVHT